MLRTPHRAIALAVGATIMSLTATACGPSAADSDPDSLTFGIIPYENSSSVSQDYQPLVDLIARETGREVHVETVTDYAALIEGQRAGTIDLAFYGPTSYVLAKDSGVGIQPVAVPVLRRGAPAGYRSYLVAKAGGPIRTVADLKGKRVCFVDPNSTSGYLYPLAALIEAGLHEDDYTSRYAGGHDASVLATRDGDCDAGAVNDVMLEQILPEDGEIDPDSFVKLWTSQPIMNPPLAVSERLDPGLRRTITTAVTEQGNAEALNVEDIAGFWGFVPIDDRAFDPLRDVCRVTDAQVCTGG
ncbi:phosphate/phosphite/phosphonate ABC transporter substrate-binding protein [Saccharomonospora saliphila]|uniref:phosphate/phosphite/phosphonate ABC transporter substrate-binding protein n=1 Tax=Saccharomonospora saliphila TaxID=369829 RepID=UPI00037A95EC|nr:phosphate/phosphite/phosphonate ABC transporter substrate-binding protein [Saccharomonospora saliphila]